MDTSVQMLLIVAIWCLLDNWIEAKYPKPAEEEEKEECAALPLRPDEIVDTAKAWADGEHAARAGYAFWQNPHYHKDGSPYNGTSWHAGWCAEKKRASKEWESGGSHAD